jgi:spore coat protein A
VDTSPPTGKFKERVVHKIQRAIIAVAAAGGLAFASSASAQVAFTKLNTNTKAANAAFPLQNLAGPAGGNYQVNYPYPGQCVATFPSALFPTLPACNPTTGSSFACETTGESQRTAGGWASCGGTAPVPFKTLAPIIPSVTTPKFAWEVLNPPDYTPDTTMYPGADYYEIGLHEANGFQAIASAGLFPNPPAGPSVPSGMQWTGLVCNIQAGCACPADVDVNSTFGKAYCPGGKIPQSYPLLTPIWGVGQINMGGGPVTGVLSSLGTCSGVVPAVGCTVGAIAPAAGACAIPAGATVAPACVPLYQPGVASTWSKNNYVATWPSISIRATTGTPVVVKWTNEFPNTHVLCPHPDAADWPCAIDRTFMGVKATIDHALAGGTVAPDGVNRYGSPQQPDNSWVTHLHGGEIPPSTDGFAMKWFGNKTTAAAYNGVGKNSLMPPFENPSKIALSRPTGNADVYAYPMVQEEATIWFHDHSIGKTHHNVIAGPAGFFPVKDPSKHGAVDKGTCATNSNCDYTWLDPVTEPRNALGIPLYDLFLAVQDRAFNEDGSINFSNGLGQTPLPPPPPPGTVVPVGAVFGAVGQTPITAGVNPMVHPVWVPEYFGDHALVNGVLWPKKTVEKGWYRIRIVNGSDSRCYTWGLLAQATGSPAPVPGTDLLPAAHPTPGTPIKGTQTFYVIANDQGYLGSPAPVQSVTFCPGERYEILVDFGNLTGIAAGDAEVYMVNNAPAPFPMGVAPDAVGSPYADMNVIMRFDVRVPNAAIPALAGLGKGVPACTTAGLTWPPTATTDPKGCMPANPATVTDPSFFSLLDPTTRHGVKAVTLPAKVVVRHVYLNEKLDGVTLMPLGMQLNGVPFEYKVTETPNFGNREVWKFVNLTVDTHPMHPHLVRHQVVSRQGLDVLLFKADLCGSTTCQPGTAPGNEMQVIPNVDGVNALNQPYLFAGTLTGPASYESGWKDVVQVPPNAVTTIVADWTPRWNGADPRPVVKSVAGGYVPVSVVPPTAPGTAGNALIPGTLPGACPTTTCGMAAATTSSLLTTGWVYEGVITGPYVWHCHINSHEDSEMMRTSLVVP